VYCYSESKTRTTPLSMIRILLFLLIVTFANIVLLKVRTPYEARVFASRLTSHQIGTLIPDAEKCMILPVNELKFVTDRNTRYIFAEGYGWNSRVCSHDHKANAYPHDWLDPTVIEIPPWTASII
jgi:hypothetical protein